MLEAGGAIRRAGSGALGLADVAAGRVEAYAELHINAWDCAAGIVLVKEAGGFTNDFFAGDGLRSGNPLIATNAALCGKLAAVIGIPTTCMTSRRRTCACFRCFADWCRRSRWRRRCRRSRRASSSSTARVQEEWCRPMVQAFEKATGIKVAMTRKSSGEFYAQIKAEAANPKGDIWWGGTGDPHLQAAEEGPDRAVQVAEHGPSCRTGRCASGTRRRAAPSASTPARSATATTPIS